MTMTLNDLFRRRDSWPPVAFSRAIGKGNTHATGTSHQHRSAAGAHSVFAVTSGLALLEDKTPASYREAMACGERPQWVEAMKSEIEGCIKQHTWDLVRRDSLPSDANVIPCKWVFKIKTDELGRVTKYKARITPKGFKQRHGIDYFEVFANTGKYKSMRVLLAIAARRNMELRQYDVPQAFTQAELKENVYMEMPEGFEQEGMVCHLLRSLYGLKQSPRNWYLLVSVFLTKGGCGFRATVSDPCLFWKVSRSGRLILLFLFVDDMQVAFESVDGPEWEESHELLRKRFNISDLGESKYMLGMRITRDRAARTITLDQELYITKALEKFGLHQCKPAPTPAVQTSSSVQSPVGDREGEPTDLKLYQEKVGTLLYAAISTRPDIAFAVNKLAQSMQSPTVANARACDRVFRYLSGSKDAGLLFGRGGSSEQEATITAYADSDWGSDPTNRKSITGWVAMLNGDPISWASKKQKVVSQSTCEAELYAEAAGINELKWLSGLLTEIGVKRDSDRVPVLYGDNQSTIELTKNGVKSERTKHIDIKYAYVTDEVSEGRIVLEWIPTTRQLADVLTKALGAQVHHPLKDQLMVSARGNTKSHSCELEGGC